MLLEKLCPLVKRQPRKGARSPGDKKMSEVTAGDPRVTPQELAQLRSGMAEYYGQRTSEGGFIISESTEITPHASAYHGGLASIPTHKSQAGKKCQPH
jgi:hypothetical protein